MNIFYAWADVFFPKKNQALDASRLLESNLRCPLSQGRSKKPNDERESLMKIKDYDLAVPKLDLTMFGQITYEAGDLGNLTSSQVRKLAAKYIAD